VKVGGKQLFAFGFLSIPLSMGGLPLALYLTPYYATELGIGLTAIGIILMLTRITDVVTDPLIGMLSDRTPMRYGRRGSWILLGLPVMATAIVVVFDPFVENPGHLYLFLGVASLYLGWTLIGIPLAAWVAELSEDYHERSRITGARTWGAIVGSLLAIVLPLLLAWLAARGSPSLGPLAEGSLQPMLRILAWSTVGVLIVAVPLLLWFVPQPRFPVRERVDLRRGLRVILTNTAFFRLLMANVMSAIAWNSINTLFIFFVTFYLLADATQWPIIVLTYLIGQFVGTPIIMALAPRFSKHRMLATAIALSVAIFSLVLLFEPGDYYLYMALNFVTGLLAPANAILAPSMAADVIDQDTVDTGEQRGALFMALWGMADKFAIAASAAIALPLVALFGFDPQAANDPAGLKALHYSFCLVPCVFFALSIAFIWGYPLTRERHQMLRERLSEQDLAATPVQP
jgi:glycoside/pentoside/hexuronide:cation symporter, GPH family